MSRFRHLSHAHLAHGGLRHAHVGGLGVEQRLVLRGALGLGGRGRPGHGHDHADAPVGGLGGGRVVMLLHLGYDAGGVVHEGGALGERHAAAVVLMLMLMLVLMLMQPDTEIALLVLQESGYGGGVYKGDSK